MAYEEFIDSLRAASRSLAPTRVVRIGGEAGAQDDYLQRVIQGADLWLTRKSVEGFDPADFARWPERDELSREVSAFLAIAEQVPPKGPATRHQRTRGRRYLDRIIEIVRARLLHEWLEALSQMMEEATAAARARGWYVERDEKQLSEGFFLGTYQAPRLRIRTQDREVVLDPIARLGSGRQGIVDLVVMPTYETLYLVTFGDGRWQIVPLRGSAHPRPFTQATFVNTVVRLPIPNASP